MTVIKKQYMQSRTRMLNFLQGLSTTPDGNGISVYWPSSASNAELESHLRESVPYPEIYHEVRRTAAGSATGIVFFKNANRFYLIIPPFPVPKENFIDILDTDEMRSLLIRDYVIALVLVRLGSYGVGVCCGEQLVASKVGTGLVHGRHRQGGSSAHRFERHRDKQIEYFMTRICRHAREHVEPYVKSLDFIVYGGARTTILTLQKQCDFLGRLDIPSLPPLLDIQDPRQMVLEESVSRVWSSTVTEWNNVAES